MHQYMSQGRTCAYCLIPSPTAPEPDHVIALSQGGRNDMTNIVASCPACNADKRDLSLSEWQTDRARRKRATVNINLTGARFPRLVIDSEKSNIRSLVA
jgi:5-methylcytosine-specific restriction endonuclease McrA